MKTSTAIQAIAIGSIIKSGYSIYTSKKRTKALRETEQLLRRNFEIRPLQPFPTDGLIAILEEQRRRSDTIIEEYRKKFPMLELNPGS